MSAVRLTLRRTRADRCGVYCRRVRLEEIDVFAIFGPDANRVYYVLRDESPLAFGQGSPETCPQ